jgi:hypothetical protein
VPTDEELAQLKDLEAAWTKARRAFGAKMAEHYPNSGRRRRPISDEEANDEIEPFAARAHEAEIALLEARKKLGV